MYDHVRSVLKTLREDGHDVDAEIRSMLAEIRQSKETAEDVTWSEVFQCRKAVIIGCGLMFFQVREFRFDHGFLYGSNYFFP